MPSRRPCRRAAAPRALRRPAGTAPRRAAAAAAERQVAGQETSRRLPPTSTTTFCRSARLGGVGGAAPEYGSIVLSNSVSIQRV